MESLQVDDETAKAVPVSSDKDHEVVGDPEDVMKDD